MESICYDSLLTIIIHLSLACIRVLSRVSVTLRRACIDYIRTYRISDIYSESDLRYYIKNQRGRFVDRLPRYAFILNYNSLKGKVPIRNVTFSNQVMTKRCMIKLASSRPFRKRVKERTILDFPSNVYIEPRYPPRLDTLHLRGNYELMETLSIREWNCDSLRMNYSSVDEICPSLVHLPRGIKSLTITTRTGDCCHMWLKKDYLQFLRLLMNMRLINLDISDVSIPCCKECMLNDVLVNEIGTSRYPPENLKVFCTYSNLDNVALKKKININSIY